MKNEHEPLEDDSGVSGSMMLPGELSEGKLCVLGLCDR